MSAEQLGDYLLDQGRLDRPGLDHILKERSASGAGESFAATLVRLGVMPEQAAFEAWSAQSGVPLVRTADFPEIPILEERVSNRFLKESRILPLREEADAVQLAMANPDDGYVLEAMRLVTNRLIQPRLALPSELDAAFERLYGADRNIDRIVSDIVVTSEEDDSVEVQHLKDLASEAPVIRLVNLVFERALDARASDIHIEPFESRLIIRYRIDGVMVEQESPPRRLSAAVISRIKIMSSLDIAERRLPQDGRIKLRIKGREVDLRVSTVPTMHGESVVMRILDKGGVPLNFDRLGFDKHSLKAFMAVLTQPHGIVLVTGPTGSGKTTTLYTALQMLNKSDVKILTVEDPVEYQMEGVNQIQVKPQIGLTFANALRSIVRQDPDVIMIGEIRDLETAQIAVQSALTGHVVISTLHTNDAPSTVNRLLDMGVDDYLLTSTVNGILAQRLVRTLCPECAEYYQPLPEVLAELGMEAHLGDGPLRLKRPVGCEACGHTGFIGRTGILEVMPITDGLRSMIMQHAVAGELRRMAISEGMRTLYEDGINKVLAGVTTLDEVLRVTRDD
ncbi:MAG: type II secretion system protein GspE [Hydrogenophilales bacterium CG03_land_8_20_14_0_80_62_28]|nr:type II secretion system ATPase GspE [Betaproteobacteria bacterium]OIO78007.1 MAG: type II secretion system protein GspE [Hydrogenophilaceae bacterium CG1_02_62_390]PIV21708.1 MAG: type II secretion system protein GspE [Hydrogenophilales bacterium CG03_land_8_20_14_0_80_62_28]PIW38980.1 MAG: type II secretion system protein GspE [Hydrogenophilales bacterium CG15_BIG_FIL_POST_REV_8_21_14_020_62_31]PIW71412.1 MAG: type II secretion system protein GspE [Hydrogenophilales bacterium CG12_big_fil_